MPKYPQALGKSMKSMGISIPADNSEGSDEMYYPHVTLEWDKKYDLPESGTITFKFTKSSETNNPDPKAGQPRQRVELDLTSLEDVEADELPEAEEEDSGEVLDKALKKKVRGKASGETMDDGEDY